MPAALADSAQSGAALVRPRSLVRPGHVCAGRGPTHWLQHLPHTSGRAPRPRLRCPTLGWCTGVCLRLPARRLYAPAHVLGAAQHQAGPHAMYAVGCCSRCQGPAHGSCPICSIRLALCCARLCIKLPNSHVFRVLTPRRLPTSWGAASPVEAAWCRACIRPRALADWRGGPAARRVYRSDPYRCNPVGRK